MMVKRASTCLLVVLLATSGAWSQAGHQHARQPHEKLPAVTPVCVYRIDATVVPDSALVRGVLDIEFANRTTDTLYSIGLRLGTTHGATCVLDSLLMYGAPVPDSGMRREGALLHVDIPMSLVPGRRVSFLTSYTCYLPEKDTEGSSSGSRLLDFWHPEIATYGDSSWCCPGDGLFGATSHPPAQYQVMLRVDSAWSLVFPGRLINEKEHFGLIRDPDSGEVLVDIMQNHSQEPFGEPYRPVFETGIKTYTISALSHGMALVAFDQPVYDRASVGGVQITTVYNRSESSGWPEMAAASAAVWLEQLSHEAEVYPYEKLMLARVDTDRCFYQNGPLLALPLRWDSAESLSMVIGVSIASIIEGTQRTFPDSAEVRCLSRAIEVVNRASEAAVSPVEFLPDPVLLDSLRECAGSVESVE